VPEVWSAPVRFVECDQQGVVFNAHYLMYFDVALTELWREALGPYGEMLESGTDMVVAEARARYLAPAGFDDEIDVEVRVARLGVTGMTTRLTVRRHDTVAVEGEMRHVFIDPATKAKKPIPDEIRRGLEPFVEEAPEPALEAQRSSTAV
jgi:acyl-CoA thioester hydrolase